MTIDSLLIVPVSQPTLLHKSILTHRVFASGGPIEELCFALHGPAEQLVGGIVGLIYASALFVQLLWIADDYQRRGHGTRLLTKIEEIAADKGCIQAVAESFSFHAPAFYIKHGYNEVGRVAGLGPDGRDFRVSLAKSL